MTSKPTVLRLTPEMEELTVKLSIEPAVRTASAPGMRQGLPGRVFVAVFGLDASGSSVSAGAYGRAEEPVTQGEEF
ncbi:MAG TPA: hypothetical protein VGM10_18705 [Actinocrinis sp.]|jgi:hypothetical protein